MSSITRIQQRPSRGRLSPRAATALLHGLIATAISVIGVLGVLQPSIKLRSSHGWIDVHAVFGVALFLGVLIMFAWHASHHAFTCARSVADLARRLSRQVYLLLYVLVAVKEIAFLVAAPELSLADAMKGLQSYVAYGVFALLSIRVMAALCHFYVIPGSLRGFHRP
jgi:cytochrome b561